MKWATSLEVNWSEHEADHSPVSSSKVYNLWRFTSRSLTWCAT